MALFHALWLAARSLLRTRSVALSAPLAGEQGGESEQASFWLHHIIGKNIVTLGSGFRN